MCANKIMYLVAGLISPFGLAGIVIGGFSRSQKSKKANKELKSLFTDNDYLFNQVQQYSTLLTQSDSQETSLTSCVGVEPVALLVLYPVASANSDFAFGEMLVLSGVIFLTCRRSFT